MNKNRRIVFYGTPDFAVSSLSALVENGYNIVGVVTSVDKPAGRGYKIQYSKVKEYALEKGLNLLQPKSLKSLEFIEELKALDVELQIVVAFRMMPKEVYSLPKYGTFNLHGSLLPKYRGAAPIHWAVINGEKETGLTTFLLNDKIDEGEIIFQYKTSIAKEETTGELYQRLMDNSGELVLQTVEAIFNQNYTPIPQSSLNVEPCLAPKLTKENTRIDWSKKGEEIVNFIRGLCPFPCANTSFIGLETQKRLDFKVFKGVFIENKEKKNAGILDFCNNEEIRVSCQNGYVQIVDLQISGKRRMSDKEFLRGAKLNESFIEIDK
ncbi:MAG: methionyl-tRNA formyltransferase [Bacteroidales bacterium]